MKLKTFIFIIFALSATLVFATNFPMSQPGEYAGVEDCGKSSEWLNICLRNFSPELGGGPGFIRGGLVALRGAF